MLRHGVYLCVKFFFDLDHVLLVSFGDKVDSQSDLSESAWPAYSVKIDAAFGGEIEVDDDIDSLHIDASCDEVRTDQRFELSFSEPFKALDSFVRFHIWVQVLILIFFLIEFAG